MRRHLTAAKLRSTWDHNPSVKIRSDSGWFKLWFFPPKFIPSFQKQLVCLDKNGRGKSKDRLTLMSSMGLI